MITNLIIMNFSLCTFTNTWTTDSTFIPLINIIDHTIYSAAVVLGLKRLELKKIEHSVDMQQKIIFDNEINNVKFDRIKKWIFLFTLCKSMQFMIYKRIKIFITFWIYSFHLNTIVYIEASEPKWVNSNDI